LSQPRHLGIKSSRLLVILSVSGAVSNDRGTSDFVMIGWVIVVVGLIWWFLAHGCGRKRFLLDEKVVLITGGARGIGKRLVETIFAETRSGTIVVLDVDDSALTNLQARFPSSGARRVLTFVCDVADET
jgi:short chain dehydrogenase